MAVGGCGYKCNNKLTGAEIDFPHFDEDNHLCPRVHLDCLVNNASQKMWNKSPLLCPTCANEGNAHWRIPLKQRILFQINKHQLKAYAASIVGSASVSGGVAAASTYGSGMNPIDSTGITAFVTIFGGLIGAALANYCEKLSENYKYAGNDPSVSV